MDGAVMDGASKETSEKVPISFLIFPHTRHQRHCIVPQEDAKGKGGDLEMKGNADDVPPSKLKIAAPSEPEEKVDAKEEKVDANEEKVDAKEEKVDSKTGGKEEKGESTITVSSLPGKEEKAANGEKDN